MTDLEARIDRALSIIEGRRHYYSVDMGDDVDPLYAITDDIREALTGDVVEEADQKKGLRKVLAYVENLLDNLVRRGGAWGPPAAVENQYLTVLKIRRQLQAALRGRQPEPTNITNPWVKVLREHGYSGQSPLSNQTEGYDALFELLPKLRAQLDGSALQQLADIELRGPPAREVIEGLLEITRLALHDPYFKSDSRVVAARQWLEAQDG